MKEFEVKWKRVVPNIGPDFYKGYVGQWVVFTIKYAMTKAPEGDYILSNTLPGMTTSAKRQETIEEGFEEAQTLLECWIEKAKTN